jgi:TetR/AcrR family transcriptional regulator
MALDNKQVSIVEAAIKRFAHFGVAKTTMTEIATDLSLSKASLYYYFPDKLNLYGAVLQYIADLDAREHEKALEKENDPFKAIIIYLEHRTGFIIKYYNILEFLKTISPSKIPEELQSIFSNLKKRELHRLFLIINKGVQSGIFKIKDVKKTTELFFDFLDGFRTSFIINTNQFFPDKKQFRALLNRETEFALIFLNGLTIKKLP